MRTLWGCVAIGFLSLAGQIRPPELKVPEVAIPISVDGQLNETVYSSIQPLTAFVAAGAPGQPIPRTAAWVFWSRDQLVFAFDCEDSTPIALAPTADEKAVDGQDRVELFLWSGKPQAAYYCMEIAALGAVHDYRARFYRRFDSAWSVPGWTHAVSQTAKGYSVEAAISRQAMEKSGFRLKAGRRFRAGLFRADFHNREPNQEPTWITWVDARTAQPDFHVAGSFGWFRLVKSKQGQAK